VTRPAAQRLAAILAGARGALAERLFPRRIETVEALGRFVGQRSAYVAQTALYGYLKTRMGTKFPQYFADDAFAASIKHAAVRQFVSCSADLTVHAAGRVAAEAGMGHGEAAALAGRCYALALGAALAPSDAHLVPEGAATAFAERAARTVWAGTAGEAAFAGSIADLIRHAPVTDEFRALDASIVGNSIRFRWRDVRAQLQRRLDGAAVGADWRARTGP
jgi:hypothetical protein